jgi:hypothetical protein
MSKTLASLAALAFLLGLGVHAAPAQAQLSRTFVSAATGNDANNCDRPTPCRTFQGAHDKTNDQGEITVLDPGGYGALEIDRSISIVNDGVGEASILVSGGSSGISIIRAPTAVVSLRGITIQGIGFGGGQGMFVSTVGSLTLANCVIRNHTADGILFAPRLSGTYNIVIANTLLADNGESGIEILGQSNTTVTVRAVLDHVRVLNNSIDGVAVDGIFAAGTIAATVTDSVSANNVRDGFVASSGAGKAATSLMLVRSVAANNGNGLHAGDAATATLRVGQSSITGNDTGWVAFGGAPLQSFGDNYIADNSTGDFAPPPIATK